MIDAIRTWHRANPLLTFALWFHVALGLFALAALPFDHRKILGLNPWVKPLKFDLSTVIFLFTTAVLLRLLAPAFKRFSHLVAIMVSSSMIVENSVISLQSLRGVRSHMNFTTVFNSTAFALMGVFIIVNTIGIAILFILWCFPRRHARPQVPPAITLGARLGLATFLAGSIEGTFMVRNLGHTIGAKDGGPGLPFLNWSTAHGDLRVAHFFALHCLQAMILAGWALSHTTWRPSVQLTTLTTAFILYAASVWLLFHQAMAGHPLFT